MYVVGVATTSPPALRSAERAYGLRYRVIAALR